jgi:hypothetical protein
MRALAVLPPDRWMQINLLATLRRHYCADLQVFHYSGGMGWLGSKTWRAERDELNDRLVEVARELKTSGRLDLIFCLVYDDFLRIDTAARLQALGVPMINYHVDMAFQWYRVIRTAPYFDILAVAQMTNAQYLHPYNPNIVWMPMAANPDFYCAQSSVVSRYQYSVSFVGSFNPYRRALLVKCVESDQQPVVFGRGWDKEVPNEYRYDWDWYKVFHDLRHYALPRWRGEGVQSVTGPLMRKLARRHHFRNLPGLACHPPCPDEQLPAIFQSSIVNLGFSDTGWHKKERLIPSGNLQSRLRDFEVPMSGGFYLVQEVPEHRHHYNLGMEVDTWSQPEELADKVKFYTVNERVAERIRVAGQRRALDAHTWKHRFDSLFRHLRCRSHLVAV